MPRTKKKTYPFTPLAKDWMKALLSGKYKQGEGALHKEYSAIGEHRYCCLGVLCEVAIANGIKLSKKKHKRHNEWSYGGKCDYPTKGISRLAGLSHDGVIALASLNDRGRAFKEIVKKMKDNPTYIFEETE